MAEQVEPMTVGQVATAYGITVRTLHHYDEIGLLVPSERSYAGYRLYTASDLSRLQSIVVYRRLGFGLEEIAELLAAESSGDATAARVEHLRRQRATVRSRLDELSELVGAIDRALEREMSNQPATPHDLKELFGESFDDYQGEAEERWGETDAWKESKRRTARYTKADWAQVKEESDALARGFLDAKRAGLPPTSTEAMDAAEAHRQHIDTRFYACPPAFHRNLGELYVSDPRYTENYDGAYGEPGLSEYVRAAIMANADRQEAAGTAG
ncbi:HTH-type transcriptional activator tipA [Nostocoides japonicum T1-X7]|uniref:HTH-type transcriptional activator tipA n=1 Tax=Nostocoides japonicum T1-X7 TaxID=1194083 RepID=A0A077LUX6_9MICO|nr:HTH-type transcriptional activator tipA [Tetrasphaera japonica T1-X7]